MNLLNIFEDTQSIGFENLRALLAAGQQGHDAVLDLGGEPVTLDQFETRFMCAQYRAYLKAGRQEEFITALGNPQQFDRHMRILRQLVDKQKNFRGSVPGERGVTGDVPQGVAEGQTKHAMWADAERMTREQFCDKWGDEHGEFWDNIMADPEEQIDEIAQRDPNLPNPEMIGKLNWQRLLRAYMNNLPYVEFEFGGSTLTIYRTQMYAILKYFGGLKPAQKVNIILTIFGDKFETVAFLDKMRAKNLIPKKVPAIQPATPVDRAQMELPGLKEAESQKKNSSKQDLDRYTAVSPTTQNALRLMRARQPAATSDIEALVKDEIESQERTEKELEKLRADSEKQDNQIKQLADFAKKQSQTIDDLEQELNKPAPTAKEPEPEYFKKSKTAEPTAKEKPKAEPKAEPTAKEKPKADTVPTVVTAPEPIKQTQTQKQKNTKIKYRPVVSKPTAKQPPTQVKQPKPKPVDLPLDVPADIAKPQAPTNVVYPPEFHGALGGLDPDFGYSPDEEPQLATGTDNVRPFRESSEQELHIGSPVIITGNVEFKGKTGDIVDFGRDKNFVIVDLYNFGKHSFHRSNVAHNDYADQEDYLDEDNMEEADVININRSGNNPLRSRSDYLDKREHLYKLLSNPAVSSEDRAVIRQRLLNLEKAKEVSGIK
jgi:hypothetical protein